MPASMLIRGHKGSLYSGANMRIDLHQDGWNARQYAAVRWMSILDRESEATAVRVDGHERL
jgi:hypothetical protein